MEGHTEVTDWPAAPEYAWSGGAKERRKVECERPSDQRYNFFRSARWCHDASSILTTAEDRVLRVYDCTCIDDTIDIALPRSFSQPDAINAATWYPSASSTTPETFCFVASVRDTPVRLIDATDGRTRAAYPVIDHRERFVSPHCLTFNPAGTKVYAGHENAIEVLDIADPGPDTSERLKTTSTRKERDGQKGIISSIVFCTDYSGTYAAGSFSGSAAIYSEDTAATAVAHLDGVHPGGVTQLAFHPLSPQTLFVGSRRSSSIQIFDLRDTSAPVGELARKGGTNQRLLFDVDPWGRWLASGDEDGTVKVWDITDLSKPPVLEEQLHQDAVGTVQLHPLKPLLLSVGGSRSFLHAPEAASISDSDTDSDFDNESDSGPDGSSSDSSNMGSEDAGRGTAMSGSAGGKSANSTSSPTAGPAASGTLSTRASTRLSAGAMDASLRVYSFA